VSSSDNDPKKAEEMSLAELLDKSDAASAPADETPHEESDDDKSGLINMAQMAAMLSSPPPQTTPSPDALPHGALSDPSNQGMMTNTGVAPIQTQSAPPPVTRSSMPGGYPASPMSQAGPDVYADIRSPKKKSKMPVVAIIFIALIAGGVGAYMALTGGLSTETTPQPSDTGTPNTATSMVTDETTSPATTAPAAAPDATGEAAASAVAAGDEEEIAAGGDTDEDYEITEEEVDDGKGGKKKRRVRRLRHRSRKSTTSNVVATASTATENAPASTTTKSTTKKQSSGGNTSELDSLLSGGSSSGSSKDSGGLPDKPSRAQVQKAMASVVNKARNNCRNSGSGKVSVRIIVGSNGVVRDAVPLGPHAADSLGRCVATFARKTARLPQFRSATFTFTYPFNI
jgi:hypothetical protein